MQISDTLKLHISGFSGAGIALLGFALSPDFYNKLPEKYAHFCYFLAVAVATFAPQLLKKTPDISGKNDQNSP